MGRVAPEDHPVSCLTCRRFRKKRCPGIDSSPGGHPCIECERFHIECIAPGTGRPIWYNDRNTLKRCRVEIKTWIASKRKRSHQGVLSISNLLTPDAMSPVLNPVDPFADQLSLPSSPGPLTHLTYFSPEESFTQFNNPPMGPGMLQSPAEEPFPWDLYLGPTYDTVATPLPDTSVISSEGVLDPAEMDLIPLSADFNTRQLAGEPPPTLSGTGGRPGEIPNPRDGFICCLDPSALNAALGGQDSLRDPLDSVLPMFAFLLTTYLPQVRSLIFVVDDADMASINERIQRLGHPLRGLFKVNSGSGAMGSGGDHG